MADPILTGTVGLVLRLTFLNEGVAFDPAGASYRELTIVKPSGARIVRADDEVSVGTDSDGRKCLEYVTAEDELDEPSIYTVLGYLEDDDRQWPARPVSFRVHDSMRV